MACVENSTTIAMAIQPDGAVASEVIVDPSGSNLMEATSQGLAVFAPALTIPPGVIFPFAGPVGAIPPGWLYCDGSAVNRTTYATLFGVIGTIYGVGDGATTFNLPDARGRTLVGLTPSGGHADVSQLSLTEGVTDVSLRKPKHNHTVLLSDPGHHHAIPLVSETGNNNFTAGATDKGNQTTPTNDATTGITVTVGVAGPLDAPAYLVVGMIIKT